MIKLYQSPLSSNSRKVRIALIEKGLDFERANLDLAKREHKNPEYLRIHPFGQVPAIDDDGFIVYDSTIINEYLEDEYPYPPLLPKDSEGRARARLMEDFRDNYLNAHLTTIYRETRAKPEGQRDQKLIDQAKAEIGKCFERIERELEGKEYLAATFSLADIAFMSNLEQLERFQIPIDPKLKHTRTWIERLKSRPSYAQSAT